MAILVMCLTIDIFIYEASKGDVNNFLEYIPNDDIVIQNNKMVFKSYF